MKQKIGRSYIKCRLKWIAAVTGCGIVMTAVLFLNEVPAGEIAYGMLLCLGILLLAVTMDGISYGRRHRELLALRQSITVSLENLPEPGEILEEDYQRLLGLLAEEKMRIWNTAVSEKRDLMEYYTMWVHQVKTPIAALKLLIEEEVDIPGEEEPLGEDRERLQQQREKRRDEELQQLFAIEQYVNMALSYMRLGSETTDFVLRQTDLDGVIRMAVRRYARHFISKKITLHYEETGARVLTDEKWLGFVIEQLLSNALKYTHEGSITIGMEKGRLTITDTGIGIRAEDLPRVCEKGYTGYNRSCQPEIDRNRAVSLQHDFKKAGAQLYDHIAGRNGNPGDDRLSGRVIEESYKNVRNSREM